MEENDIIEEIFGPDPAEVSSSENNLQSEDDLFNEIELHASEESLNSERNSSESNSEDTNIDLDSDDFTDKFLARIGIPDKNAIPWLDSSGAMFTRAWDTLTEEEQLNILSSANTDPETDLDSSEIQLINQIRESGLTPELYMQNYAKQIEDQYALQNKHFEIDDWTDDEVYVIDLMQRLGDQLSEEQIENALIRAKEDPTFFKSEVENIRASYKNKEEELELAQTQEIAKQQELNFLALSHNILNEISQFNTVAGVPIELDYNDQNNLANYILTRDQNGLTQYNKDMNSPLAIVHNAFWALYGPLFLLEAEAESARAFRRGYEQARRDLNSQAAVEIRSTNKRKSNYFNT